jgi:uncharacterized phage infection (PIP) family protein YhgE
VTDFDQAAEQALAAINALYATTEAARARFADLRDWLATAGERLESDWGVLRERANHFQQQAGNETQLLAAGQSSVHQSLEALHGATGQVLEEVPPEVHATHGGFEEMATRVDALETETTRVVDQSDEAEAALQARLEEVETDLGAALAEADDLLHSALLEEIKEFERAIESETVHLGAYFAGECVPALAAKAQELYDVLVQADEDVRAALDAAATSSEESSELALRDCAANYDAQLSQIGRLGDTMEDLLKDLRDFVDDGRERLEDRQERWEDHARDTRDSLREALDKLKELQDHLAHHGFGG